jgi:hypothetical protein
MSADSHSASAQADRLLRLAAHGFPAAAAAAAPTQQRALSLRHSQACRAEAQRVRSAPVKALHAVAQETQKIVLNRDVASTHDQRLLEGPVQRTRTWKAIGAGSWKQRTGHEACRITFSNPAMTMLDIARSLRPKASHGHCTAVLQTGICIYPKLYNLYEVISRWP